ncbi:conserved hypothetical protein [Histoplasma capsulatum G186AR]|uniref:WW domain-binding protein n=1 Tax=Ajellomyces capsulatus (strain G186AR / H82 / ATCC MYA-2454 / RMSCC 2432) TaxID=447093 RepID=C0NJU1_AJECG|nr:uncharacterized protein HCBG_03421 [Histoplasma capsulatum G186AR]EEH08132.1 conserved hypothetical protein [Histoplasma capsulatum G186AR]
MLSKLRPSSWVMLHETEGFVGLPNERIMYTSPTRTSLLLQSGNPRPGIEPLSIQSSTGCVYLTNQRVVYLPTNSTPQFQSFSAPLLNLQDTHVSAPFFGPNIWTAQVKPVAGGGIPPSHAYLQLKLTFKDGGAFDFHSGFERIKERLQQALEQSQENGSMRSPVDLSLIHLDELPAYEAPAQQTETTSSPAFSPVDPLERNQQISNEVSNNTYSTESNPADTNPTEPPPGYEEVQQQSVANALETCLRKNQ